MLAYGIFNTKNDTSLRVGLKKGKFVFDLKALCELGQLDKNSLDCYATHSLNKFIALGKKIRAQIKEVVMNIEANETLLQQFKAAIYLEQDIIEHMPLTIGGYTDFYASKQHATNIGSIFRPDNPLLPNWVHLPIAYNGRASSIVIDKHNIIRPHGQILQDGKPIFASCRKLDFEVELGVIIGRDSTLGTPIKIEDAADYIFGICLVNDWSARDIQAWEYQPLGPFTSKSFATSISSFIIPIEEFDAYKVNANMQNPPPLPYLHETNPITYDIQLEVELTPHETQIAHTITRTNFKYMYWTINQWIAQHTVTGCNLKIGDLLASGTISGNNSSSLGSLMEITRNGQQPLELQQGVKRSFLENGDKIRIKGLVDNTVFASIESTVKEMKEC
ncbi:MAG: fumarylacetoacetase [Burkholderiales bacterium]|nr:fumarylacetoacetase [Burkholderiales bacterium]